MKKYFPIKLFYQTTFVFTFLIIFFNSLSVLGQKDLNKECVVENGDGNAGLCIFGDEWSELPPIDRTTMNPGGGQTAYKSAPGTFVEIACSSNTAIQGGKADTPWTNYNFFCVGIGKRDVREEGKRYYEPNYEYPKLATEGWVQCPKGMNPTSAVNRSYDLIEREIKSFQEPFTYLVGTTTVIGKEDWLELNYKWRKGKIRDGCTYCGSNRITDCSGYTQRPRVSPCAIDQYSPNCTFGNVNSTLKNTNCANTDFPNDRKQVDINGTKYTYFCSSKGETYRCAGNGSYIYDSYDTVFNTKLADPANPSSTRLYEVPKTQYNCTLPADSKEQCELKNTSTSSTDCRFGSYVTTLSDTKKNCATLNEKVEDPTITSGYRYVVCSPDNKKYSCNYQSKDISYAFLFTNFFDATRGGQSYEGGRLSFDATSKYDCKPYAPPARDFCKINTTPTDTGDCLVPVGCFNKNEHPIVDIGSEKFALYCMSKSDSDKYDGYIYYCPLEGNSAYDYAEVSVNISDYIRLSGTQNCKRYINSFIDLKLRELDPLSPLGLIKSISTALYYFAVFYFIVLILLNAFSYVRSGEDPNKLKQIKESLFNTIAGFIFVIASGGVIVYLINQLS